MAANITWGASSGASSSSRRWKYDVFLSFCGKDTRKNFTDHLFNSLKGAGIHAFRDKEELNRGEDISSELMAAIEDSKVAVIVFSENYASSTWCLGELLKILDCKRDGKIEKVLPVFYNINPSDVRKQSNTTYSQAFKRHKDRFENDIGKVQRWRAALTEAANLSGWDLADGHEAVLIKEIVEEVLAITYSGGCLYVAKFPTGLHFHVDAICNLLNEGKSNTICGSHKKRRGSDVRSIGIYGPGGIGKTTIAKAVFNIMSRNFDGSCFLADVREVSSQQQGSLHLQKQLLSGILKREGIEIHNEHQGINLINKSLYCKRVLIVFDDVVRMKQLDKLVGDVDWFCPGSCIILTTRDEHLLTELNMNEKYKYRVETMDEKESLRLLCRHAFRHDHPSEGYEKLSEEVVRYAGGLPLALVTLGSLLYKRIPVEWECQLKKLKEIPISDVFKILKISFDALDKYDQSAFLDISCFFIGCSKDDASKILDACYPSGEAAIKNLKERSLLTIDKRDELHMHDLIRDMGREIVCNESPKNPGGRSRVWKFDEAIDTLINLTLQSSRLTKVWEGIKDLPMLKVLNLLSSSDLTHTPDFSRLPNLERLILGSCEKLVEIHESIHCLKKLVELDLSQGLHLKSLPRGINELESLEVLNLDFCKALGNSLKGFGKLKRLKRLSLSKCGLIDDDIGGCDLGEIYSLESLDLSENNFESLPMLPSSLRSLTLRDNYKLERLLYLSNLKQLEKLDLQGCKEVTEIEGLEGLKSTTFIDLNDCKKLKTSMKRRIFQAISNKEFGDGKICDIFLPGNEVPNWFDFQNDWIEVTDWFGIQYDYWFNCRTKAQWLNLEMQPQEEFIICCSFEELNMWHGGRLHVEVFSNSKKYKWKHTKQTGYTEGITMTWVIKIPNSIWKSMAAQYEYGDTVTVSAYYVFDSPVTKMVSSRAVLLSIIQQATSLEDVEFSLYLPGFEDSSIEWLELARN